MRTRITLASIAAALVTLATPATLLATDGYFPNGWGTGQKGMAGAGVALLFGPSDTAANPAAGVFTSPALEFSIAAFSPERQFEVTGTPSGTAGHVRAEGGDRGQRPELVPHPAGRVRVEARRGGRDRRQRLRQQRDDHFLSRAGLRRFVARRGEPVAAVRGAEHVDVLREGRAGGGRQRGARLPAFRGIGPRAVHGVIQRAAEGDQQPPRRTASGPGSGSATWRISHT